jgi:hypothetical protein
MQQNNFSKRLLKTTTNPKVSRTQNDGLSTRKPYGEASFNRLVKRYRVNAKRRKLSFTLTRQQIRNLVSLPCFYCGKEPSQVIQEPDAYGPYVYTGIDRKDSAKGYTRKNCISACKDCNSAKSNMSYADWILFLHRIVKHHKEHS